MADMQEKSAELHQRFLYDQAQLMAEKLRSSEEKALKAILQAEQSRRIYNSIRELLEKKNKPLMQIDFPSPTDQKFRETLNSKIDIEQCILTRNRCHSLQSLVTPFMTNEKLSSSINPNSSEAQFDDLLSGQFLESDIDTSSLNSNELEWIRSLQSLVSQEIPLLLLIEDFKQFFKSKQEKTASSTSGRHMGHYKVALECIRWNNLVLPELILSIAYLSLTTATPLDHGNKASQVTIEKGEKGTI